VNHAAVRPRKPSGREIPAFHSLDGSKNARFVTDPGAPVVNLMAPKPGETILDLGRGAGVRVAERLVLDPERSLVAVPGWILQNGESGRCVKCR
jgi:hypothetical protein